MKNDQPLREHLLLLLKGDGAHLDFDAAVKDLPADLRGKKPKGGAHSPWKVLEHLRICQRDILDGLRDPKHVSPEFPAGYWPREAAPANGKAWENCAKAFRSDQQELIALLNDPSKDLFAPLPGGDGQTIVRRVLMAADHNSYHLGQLVLVRRMLGAWQ
jgi:DinB family protein